MLIIAAIRRAKDMYKRNKIVHHGSLDFLGNININFNPFSGAPLSHPHQFQIPESHP